MLSYEPEELAVIVSAREWIEWSGFSFFPPYFTPCPFAVYCSTTLPSR